MAISSIHIQAATAHCFIHNDRSAKVTYLVDDSSKNEFDRSAKEAKALLAGYVKQAEQFRKKNGMRSMKSDTVKAVEAVVNLNASHNLEDVQRLAEAIEKRFGFRAVQIAIHKDEGKDRQNKNYHAHIVMCNLTPEGKTIHRTLGREALREIQDLTAQTLAMDRGVKGSTAVRLEHKQFKAVAAQLEAKTAELEAVKYDFRVMQQRITALETENKVLKKELHALNNAANKTKNDEQISGLNDILKELESDTKTGGESDSQSDIQNTKQKEVEIYERIHKLQKSYGDKALAGRDKNSLHGVSGGNVVPTGDGAQMLLHKSAHNSVGSGSTGNSRVRRANNSSSRTKSKSKGLKMNGLYNDNLVSDAERRKLEAIELENYRSWVQPNGKIRYTNKTTGETIEDQGNRIEVNGTDYETLARDAVALAIAKGWKLEDLKPCGEKSFVEAVKAEVERLRNPNAITTIEEALAEVEAINEKFDNENTAKEEAAEVEAVEAENQTTEELESLENEYDEDEEEEEDTKPLKEFITVHSTGHIYEYAIYTDKDQTDGVIRMFDKMDGELILEGSVTKIGRDQYEAGKNYQEDGNIKYVFFKNGKEISKEKYIAQTKNSKSAAAADFLDKNPVNSDLDKVLKKGMAEGHKFQNLAVEFIKRQTVGANEEKSQEIVKQVQSVCEDVQKELSVPKENQNQSQTRELKL